MLFTILAAVSEKKKIQAVPVAVAVAPRPPNVAQAYEIFHAMCDVSHILRHANDAAIKKEAREGTTRGRDTKMSTGARKVVNQPLLLFPSSLPFLLFSPLRVLSLTFIWLIGFSAQHTPQL